MVSGFIGNEVPVFRLRVRVPCPPLLVSQEQALSSAKGREGDALHHLKM